MVLKQAGQRVSVVVGDDRLLLTAEGLEVRAAAQRALDRKGEPVSEQPQRPTGLIESDWPA
jgi:hypothetical protein